MGKSTDLQIVILTGMSGAGKSHALNALEDINFYCIDNLPPRFLVTFIDYLVKESPQIVRVAVMIDVRSKNHFSELRNVVKEIKTKNKNVKTLFLDCEDNVLITRYKETRRNHPLMASGDLNLVDAIKEEKIMLSALKSSFDYTIDTTMLTSSALREKIVSIFAEGLNDGMFINFVSFGFKHGSLLDADIVFDVRCMPNPFYVKELKALTGNDVKVRDYVMGFDEAKGVYKHICEYLDFTLPLYKKEGKSQLVIGLGCTGGKHRSVTFAILLSQYFIAKNYRIITNHRDIRKI